jgi:hypothetical protein
VGYAGGKWLVDLQGAVVRPGNEEIGAVGGDPREGLVAEGCRDDEGRLVDPLEVRRNSHADYVVSIAPRLLPRDHVFVGCELDVRIVGSLRELWGVESHASWVEHRAVGPDTGSIKLEVASLVHPHNYPLVAVAGNGGEKLVYCGVAINYDGVGVEDYPLRGNARGMYVYCRSEVGDALGIPDYQPVLPVP